MQIFHHNYLASNTRKIFDSAAFLLLIFFFFFLLYFIIYLIKVINKNFIKKIQLFYHKIKKGGTKLTESYLICSGNVIWKQSFNKTITTIATTTESIKQKIKKNEKKNILNK